ncbi:MAG: hypothetical protein K8R91_05790 [Phycisphaerae bacterium]|nr:hypothetical protein [Phycisphaerae bacterium]
MMKLINNLLKLALYWFLGLIIATLLAAVVLKPRWELISRLHRPGRSIIATSPELVVEDVDGTLFQGCGTNCWKEIGADEIAGYPAYITEDCEYAPSAPHLRNVTSIKYECDNTSMRVCVYRVYALHSSNEILQWEQDSGWSFLASLPYGLLFSAFVFLFGLILIFSQTLSDIILWVREKIFNIHDEWEENG